MRATWKPHEKHGRLTKQSDLPDSVYAFPKERKEPMTDARHVRNAIARFDQVEGVSDAERELAFANIKKAAAFYGIELAEDSWHDLGSKPQSAASRPARASVRKKSPVKKSSARKSTTAAPARKAPTVTAKQGAKKKTTGGRKSARAKRS